MGLRVPHAEKTKRAHLAQNGPGHHALDLPGIAVRGYFFRHETADLVTNETQVFGEMNRVGHGETILVLTSNFNPMMDLKVSL
jgi:hypothetical protein